MFWKKKSIEDKTEEVVIDNRKSNHFSHKYIQNAMMDLQRELCEKEVQSLTAVEEIRDSFNIVLSVNNEIQERLNDAMNVF